MGQLPETRHSLLLRLRDHTDQHAWSEFVEIYQPLLMSLIRRQGLQEADAQEICQELLLTVAKQVDRWDPDRKQGSFRGWLYRVSRNQILDFVRRPKYRSQAAHGSAQVAALENLTDPTQDPDQGVETEYRRHLFQWAAQRLKPQFDESTWVAFWMTCVDGLSVSEAAARLGVSAGKVYVAKCRVMARLREKVQQWTQTDLD